MSSRWNRFERSDSDRSKRRNAWKTSGASAVTESSWPRSGWRAAVRTVEGATREDAPRLVAEGPAVEARRPAQAVDRPARCAQRSRLLDPGRPGSARRFGAHVRDRRRRRDAIANLGADRVELYTEPYAASFGTPAEASSQQLIRAPKHEIENVPDIWEALESVGLSTTEACGDTPRVILGCPLAGIDADEIIDGTAEIAAIGEQYIGDAAFSNLPRKFKSAISGCPAQCAIHEINDIAFVGVAHPELGAGYDLWVGGGLSTNPMLAQRVGVWIPLDEVADAWEAVASIFRDVESLQAEVAMEQEAASIFRRLGWEQFFAASICSDDVALVAFTSGTTGNPKGCVHYHRDILAPADSFARHVLKPAPAVIQRNVL